MLHEEDKFQSQFFFKWRKTTKPGAKVGAYATNFVYIRRIKAKKAKKEMI